MADRHFFDSLIQECASERSGGSYRGMPTERKIELFSESWDAMIAWIESRLSKNKGAEVPLFGTFTWETKVENGETLQRPLFLVAETFEKTHSLKKQRTFSQPVTAQNEEINYSKIAIKFSNGLTKDSVFTALCDIIKKIGHHISFSQKFQIPFKFGTFSVNERKIKFEFDYGRLSRILPDTMTLDSSVQVVQKRANTTTGMSLSDTNNNMYSARKTVSQPSVIGPGLNQPNNKQIPPLQLSPEVINSSSTGYAPPMSPGLQEMILKMSEEAERQAFPPKKTGLPPVIGDNVLEQAFHRCLTTLETQALSADILDEQSKALQENWKENQQKTKEKKRMETQSIQEHLKKQIDEFNVKKKIEKLNRQDALISHELPGHIKQPVQNPYPGPGAKDIFIHLEHQIQANLEKKRHARERALAEEQEYLDHVAMEMEMRNAEERALHLQKQKVLLEAWEREAHIRAMKKLKDKGLGAIASYMDNNLVDDRDITGTRGGTAMSAMSVGFDSRKLR